MTVGPQGVLDLATVLRLSTGDDITPQFGGVSCREKRYVHAKKQAAAAATEKRDEDEVAEMAAVSPPAEMDLPHHAGGVSHLGGGPDG